MNGLLIIIIILASIAIVAWIVGIICIITKDKWYVARPVMSVAFSVMAGTSLITMVLGCTYPKYVESYEKHVVNILSVSRGSSVKGHFVLGSGIVSEKSYYFYYYETDKGIKLGKVETDDTYVIETTEWTPSLYEMKESNTFDVYNTLYVPVGTVMTNFVLE